MESSEMTIKCFQPVKTFLGMALLALVLMTATNMHAQTLKDKYDKNHPLKVSCENEAYPFEGIDDDGTPVGFNIELIGSALNEIGVNYTFVMKERISASDDFEANETNLLLTPVVERIPGVFYGKFEVVSYRVVLVQRKGARNINSLKELRKGDVVVARKGGYSAEKALRGGILTPEQIKYKSHKDAIEELVNKEVDYIIAGGKVIEYYIKKYGIEDQVDIKPIDVPAGKMLFVSRDKQLILALDNICNSMEQNGALHLLTDRWIYGNEEETASSPVVLFSLFWFLVAVCFLLLINRVVNNRLKHMLRRTIDTNNIVKTALEMGGNNIICSNLKTKKIKNLYGNIVKQDRNTMNQFFSFIHPEDVEGVKKGFSDMVNSVDKIQSVKYRLNVGTKSNPDWRSFVGQMAAETNKGVITNVYTTLNDITEDERKERDERNAAEVYRHIFETSITAFALYDVNGKLIRANKQMRTIFAPGQFSKTTIDDTSLFDMPAVWGNYSKNDTDNYFVCTRCDLNGSGNVDYIDFRCRPVKSDKEEILYYMVTARNMYDERQMYQQSKLQDREIRRVNNETQKFENELKILLEESNMMVWRSNVRKNTVTLYKDLRTFERRYTFDEFVEAVEAEEHKADIRKLINPAVNEGKSCNIVVKMKTDIHNTPVETWFALNSVPEYDDEGNIKGCFGLMRDIDDLINAQLKMKKETEKANDSGRLKSVFLANMTHEIRTPLNAIVGFCDVLQSVDAPEERQEFLKIILNNCDLLIQLINDILVISELDSNGLTLRPAKVDFAESFYMICTSLRQRVQDPNVEFIYENPFDHLYVVMDVNRIHQVVTNFLTNAVKYTHSGHIKLAYERRDGGLYIYCEDTGAGIPAEDQEKIFGRFIKLNDYIQGAGLGLSICKAIAEKCGGKIGVDSEVGKGSTFWIWIPEVKPES